MREVSLAILDITQNSIDAGADLIRIELYADLNRIVFEVADNGCGMNAEELASCSEQGISFKGSTGMGLSLLRDEVAATGGEFEISSEKNVGTSVRAKYNCSHADVQIGDMGSTFVALVADEYDVRLDINAYGSKFSYDSSGLKSSSRVADLQAFGALRLIREDINKNIRQNGGAML